MYVHGFRCGGGSVSSPDVIGVGSCKGRLGGRTTRKKNIIFWQGLSSMHSFSGQGGGRGSLFVWDGGAVWALVGGNSSASRTFMLLVLLGEITFQNTRCEILIHKTLPSSLRAT